MILLGLGSNVGDREQNIITALSLLAFSRITILQTSSLYTSEPVGLQEQPEFLNAAVSIATELNPQELLKVCLAIEKKMGRRRIVRWGPRNIDIDLLDYNGIKLASPELTLPHPRLQERNFVLVPLAEIAESLPIYNSLTAVEIMAQNGDSSVVRFHKKLKVDF